MGLLVNIDNGGTLTDICVIDGDRVARTKTLTTPTDLSKCLVDGLSKASALLFGEANIERLLLATDHVRYSTTQGTNALVQRKGPRLGLVLGEGLDVAAIRAENPDLYDAIVGDRAAIIPVTGDAARYDAVGAVSDLAARGASRIVIAFSGDDRAPAEASLKRALLLAFPPHLLGAVPILFAHELTGDERDIRRVWTALFNAFLHPAIERFLYSAERRLRDARAQKPLLIFRNDGQSARVAKTIAVKTYSSGPRGGAEGARALAAHYRFDRLLSIDIGGTTTDISIVERGQPRAHDRGHIEGVETSFPLTDVSSAGVGGSSIIRVASGVVTVGPESVGSLPGPACFGLGGTDATITDAFFVSGLLDPASYFGGQMRIDIARASAAIARAVGEPLGLTQEAAVEAMEKAWVARVADAVAAYADVTPDTVIAAFGGAGPFVICRVAERLGVNAVLIPKLAAVFSAFGIGFSDIGHLYQAPLPSLSAIDAVKADLETQARRGMAGEGIDADGCQSLLSIVATVDGVEQEFAPNAEDVPADASLALRLVVSAPLPQPVLSGQFADAVAAAVPSGERSVLIDGARRSIPLFHAETLKPHTGADGPAVLEEEFFTCRIDAGWRFIVNEAGDVMITKTDKGSAA